MKIKELKEFIAGMDETKCIEVLFFRGDGKAHIYDIIELTENVGNLNIVVRKEDKSVTVNLRELEKVKRAKEE